MQSGKQPKTKILETSVISMEELSMESVDRINTQTIIYPLPDQELLSKEEQAWKVKLPNDYADFIKKNNGVTPIDNSFTFDNHGYLIERFLCILKEPDKSNDGMYDIDVILTLTLTLTLTQIEDRLTDNEDLVGVEILPIAVLFAGDFLCLDYREDNLNPSVCVWCHEESGELDL
ncbi:SMI1/KNR4 family protein [Metabacillus herbersteinensis]|uniref:SMI1/KNR4 family protein n=1 Tax=Metabacillus herbersteinensis TaxID=283816 RepID=A0ABV6GFZ1_9BACI